jgi:hypothetical protein
MSVSSEIRRHSSRARQIEISRESNDLDGIIYLWNDIRSEDERILFVRDFLRIWFGNKTDGTLDTLIPRLTDDQLDELTSLLANKNLKHRWIFFDNLYRFTNDGRLADEFATRLYLSNPDAISEILNGIFENHANDKLAHLRLLDLSIENSMATSDSMAKYVFRLYAYDINDFYRVFVRIPDVLKDEVIKLMREKESKGFHEINYPIMKDLGYKYIDDPELSREIQREYDHVVGILSRRFPEARQIMNSTDKPIEERLKTLQDFLSENETFRKLVREICDHPYYRYNRYIDLRVYADLYGLPDKLTPEQICSMLPK